MHFCIPYGAHIEERFWCASGMSGLGAYYVAAADFEAVGRIQRSLRLMLGTKQYERSRTGCVNVAVELSMSLISVAGFGASTGTVREDDGYFAVGLLVVQIAEG